MYFVYALLRNNGTVYIGSTSNIKRRIKEHKTGSNRSTRLMKPNFIYCESYVDKRDVAAREAFLKTGDGRQRLKKQLKHTLLARSSNG